MSFSLSEHTYQNRRWLGHPTGELTALPRPPSWFQGGRFAAGGKWRGGEGRTRRRGEEGKGGGRGNREGKGEEKGELGNSAIVVGG